MCNLFICNSYFAFSSLVSLHLFASKMFCHVGNVTTPCQLCIMVPLSNVSKHLQCHLQPAQNVSKPIMLCGFVDYGGYQAHRVGCIQLFDIFFAAVVQHTFVCQLQSHYICEMIDDLAL